MHGDIVLNGCECMVGESTLHLVFDLVGSVKWDNIQQSRTIYGNFKENMYRYQQVGMDPPLGERPANYGQT